jgi:hypothetical protein
MWLHHCRTTAALLALACGGFGAARAQVPELDDAADRPSTQPGRSQARDEWMPQGANRSMEILPMHGLAKGVLMRKSLSDNANLSLRLRGGRIGLYLNVQMPVRD